MEPLDDFLLNRILATDANDRLISFGEDNEIEFKKELNWSDKKEKAEYAKSLAALSNGTGGYLIFGIENNTGNVVGLNGKQEVDNAEIADVLNNYFSPRIDFKSRKFVKDGKTLFVIYAYPQKEIKTVCTREFSGVLLESMIYSRYSGKSSHIKSGDLIQLLQRLRGADSAKSIELEKRKLRAQYKPHFIYAGGHTQGENISIDLVNKGQTAIIDSVKEISEVLYFNQMAIGYPIEKDGRFTIGGRVRNGINANQVLYSLEIFMRDQAGHHYKVEVNFNGQKTTVSEPIEINQPIQANN